MQDAPVFSEYLKPKQMRQAILRSIDGLANPLLLPGCRSFKELPVFFEPEVDPHPANTIAQFIKAVWIALVKISIAKVGMSLTTMQWRNVVEAMRRDVAHWSQQQKLQGEYVLCLDTLDTRWRDLLRERGGERRVSAQDMRRLVQNLPTKAINPRGLLDEVNFDR